MSLQVARTIIKVALHDGGTFEFRCTKPDLAPDDIRYLSRIIDALRDEAGEPTPPQGGQ